MRKINTLKTMSIGGATYDLFVRTKHNLVHTEHKQHSILALPLGEKIRVEEVIETCGGGASNTAVGFARLGMDAHISCILGSDQWGDALLKNFKNECVQTDCLTIVEGETSSFSIILSASSGERVILYDPGTNDHLHDATFDRAIAKHMDWIYLNHIQEGSCIIQDDIINILTGTHTPRMTWNPGGCQIDRGIKDTHVRHLLTHTTILLVNEEEACIFASEKNIEDAVRILHHTGPHIVCITQGKKGVIATDGRHIYHCSPLPHIAVVDTTGAGDAFGTGLSWATAKGYPLPDALKIGTLNAASVVQVLGAQQGLLSAKEMIRQFKKNHLAIREWPL